MSADNAQARKTLIAQALDYKSADRAEAQETLSQMLEDQLNALDEEPAPAPGRPLTARSAEKLERLTEECQMAEDKAAQAWAAYARTLIPRAWQDVRDSADRILEAIDRNPGPELAAVMDILDDLRAAQATAGFKPSAVKTPAP